MITIGDIGFIFGVIGLGCGSTALYFATRNLRESKKRLAELRSGVTQQRAGMILPNHQNAAPNPPLPQTTQDEPIIAYRAWNWKGGELYSVNNRPWVARVANAASCQVHNQSEARTHSSPNSSCDCGFYALKTPSDLANSGYLNSMLLGRVALWGRVIECTGGYRAEFAYPQSFYLGVGHDEEARKAAALFGVDCVPAPLEIIQKLEEQKEFAETVALANKALIRSGHSPMNAGDPSTQRTFWLGWAQNQVNFEAKETLEWSGWVFPTSKNYVQLLDQKGQVYGEPRRTDSGDQRAAQGNSYTPTSPRALAQSGPFNAYFSYTNGTALSPGLGAQFQQQAAYTSSLMAQQAGMQPPSRFLGQSP